MRGRVVVTNDLHSHLPRALGALHALATAREAGALVIDTGDVMEGAPWFERFGGEPELALLDALYDVVCPGNHGFAALRHARLTRCAVLNANILTEADAHAFTPWLIRDVGGASMGLIGLLSEAAFSVIPPRERAGLLCIPPRQALTRALDALASAGCTRALVLAHGGLPHDAALLDDQPRAGAVVVILSGHCHSAHHTARAAHTHAIKAPELGGWLELLVDPDAAPAATWTIHAPSPAPKTLHPTLDLLRPWLARWEAEADDTIGAWTPALAARLTTREALIGALADQLAREHPEAHVLLNVTCARGVLTPGAVRRADVQRVLPFRTQLVLADAPPPTREAATRALPAELAAALITRGHTQTTRLLTTDYLCDQLLGLDAPRRALGPLDALLWRLDP